MFSKEVMQIVRRLQEARLSLMRKQPFYAVLLLHMQFSLDPGCETAYTDGERIAFCPDFITTLSNDELEFVLMHEVLHAALNHCGRSLDTYDFDDFNTACDIVVNSNILYSCNMDRSKITLKEYGESMHLAPDGKEGYLYSVEEVYRMVHAAAEEEAEKDNPAGAKVKGRNGNEPSGKRPDDKTGIDDDGGEDGKSGKDGKDGKKSKDGQDGDASGENGEGQESQDGDASGEDGEGRDGQDGDASGEDGEGQEGQDGSASGEDGEGQDGQDGDASGEDGEVSGSDGSTSGNDGNASGSDGSASGSESDASGSDGGASGEGSETCKLGASGRTDGGFDDHTFWGRDDDPQNGGNGDSGGNGESGENDESDDGSSGNAAGDLLSKDELQDAWLQRMIEATDIAEQISIRQEGKNCGRTPLGAQRIVNELTQPQTDWRTVLDTFVQEEITDYSFNPPDRRFQDSPFLLPDFNEKDESVKDLLFMIDTSGSMSDKMITQAYSEIYGAIQQFNGRLQGWLGFFDAEVVEPKEFTDEDEFRIIRPKGGGGTSFRCIFDYVKEHLDEIEPASIIILTDGFAPWPDEKDAMDIPVLWLINNEEAQPPWGKVTRIKVEEEVQE